MQRVIKIVAIILCVAFLFTGCMSTNNLSDLTVVQALGVDSVDGQTRVTIQYLDTNKSGTATDALNGNITAVANGVSSNISDALSYASKSLSAKIFMGQNKIIIFGSEYSHMGIDKGIDYLVRSVDSRPDVLVAMSSTSAEDVVKNEQNGSRIPAENIYKLLELGEDKGLGAVVSVNDVLNLYEDATTDVYLPVLNSNEDSVSCEGVVTFANEKVAVMLDKYETFGFLFIKNRIKGGTIVVEDDELGFVGVDVVKSRCKPIAVVKDEKIIFECKIDVNILLNELENGSTSDLKPNKIIDIENLVKLRINDMCIQAFDKCMDAKSDPYAIGKYLAKSDVSLYKELKDDWHNNLDNVELKLNTNVKLKNINENSLKK